MYKYLFFDLDGTLTDSQEGITKSVSYALINLGLEDIPFEERKKRLINSEAWKGRINQRNKHLAPNDITEENIQGEIDSSAIHWGMEIEWSFKKEEWELFATSSAGCRIYIPEKNIENKY